MNMATPAVAIMTGYGINCDRETAFAFEYAGARPEIVHVNDFIDTHKQLRDYQILVIPGGFSYGDDTGSGNALANRIGPNLRDEVEGFVRDNDHLALGICNGFQVMVNLGLLPALNQRYGDRQVALVHNDSARYLDRWVDLCIEKETPWTRGMTTLSLPIAHGEGKFYAPSSVLSELHKRNLVAFRYVQGEISEYQHLPHNPNGSLEDIAGITDETGRILGLMPHPERAIAFTHLPHWAFLKEQHKREGRNIPEEGPGLQMFKNAVIYFQ